MLISNKKKKTPKQNKSNKIKVSHDQLLTKEEKTMS